MFEKQYEITKLEGIIREKEHKIVILTDQVPEYTLSELENTMMENRILREKIAEVSKSYLLEYNNMSRQKRV